MDVSIDVVIPSFRLNENNLLPLLKLTAPASAKIVFYLIVDNPQSEIPASIHELVDNRRVFLLVNEKNQGASFTRNRGIDAGTGEWVLFLDDDLSIPENLLNIYAGAAQIFPDEIGFIGLVELPEASRNFSKAVVVSGSMDIFSIAIRKSSFVWGATANIMIKRNALKGERFSLLFPKSGGGEDVDLFLRIRGKNGFKNYKTLKEARVFHPWWNEEKQDFKKPFRYGVGNSRLGELNPSYAYRDFLNTPETLAVSLAVLIIVIIVKPALILAVLFFMAGVLLIEWLASAAQTIKRNPKTNGQIIFYVLALRMVYETGLLWGNISRFRLSGMGERFHDDGKQNKLYFYRSNTHKIVKWILYPVLVYLLIRIFF